MATFRNSPIFICGHPKAGTSLLRSILDSHPEIVVYPEETSFFRRYLPMAEGRDQEQKINLAARYLIHIFQWNLTNPPEHQAGFKDRDYSGISFTAVKEEMAKAVKDQFGHDGDMLSAVMTAFGKVTGRITPRTRYWLEKTPYNERYADRIFNWWPEARCIHVVRDPRDNYVSYRRKHPDWTPEFFASNWQTSTAQGQRNLKKFGEDRYWLVTYEDFVQKPDETIAHLCSFLGISDDSALRQPTRDGREWKGNSMWSDQFSQISSAPVGRWVESLKPHEVYLIQSLAKKGMAAMGYNQSVIQMKDVDILTRARCAALLIKNKLKEIK